MQQDEYNYESNLKKANIQAMMDCGAPDEETAERWLEQDEYDPAADQANMWNAQIEAIEDSYHDQLEAVA